MSYAEIAAKGPKQSPEEKRAHPLPEIEPTESEASSMVDVDSPHVEVVRSDYEDQPVKTETQARRMEHEAEDAERQAERKAERKAHEARQKANETMEQAKEKAHETMEQAKEKAHDLSQKASEVASDAKKKAATKGKEAKEKAREGGRKWQDNRENPVVMANTVIAGVGAVALVAGAYKKHTEGQLDWKLAGSVAGAVAAFGVVDYLVSSWLVENKYPLN